MEHGQARVERASRGTRTVATARCMPASATLLAVVVPAAMGPVNDRTSMATARIIQLRPAPGRSHSSTGSDAQPASPASTLTSTTATGPTSWGEASVPWRTVRSTPARGSATAHTAKAANAAPTTAMTRVRRRDRVLEPFVGVVVLVVAIAKLLTSKDLEGACGQRRDPGPSTIRPRTPVDRAT